MISPPLPAALVAVVTLPASSSALPVAFNTILPFSPSTALLALSTPRWFSSAPIMPMRPPWATIWPTLRAWSAGADSTTRRSGLAASASCTLWPAASSTSPLGAVMMPLFSTFGAIKRICPPLPALMLPWLSTAPAWSPALKFILPARKSWFDSARLDATRPATSTRASRPNSTPFGLIRNTLPFDCKEPRILLGSCPVMRFSTLLPAFCWTKRVISPWLTEKLCQLMMVLGVFVIVNRLPCWLNVAWPCTTCGKTGLAWAALKQAAISKASAVRRSGGSKGPPAGTVRNCFCLVMICLSLMLNTTAQL